MWQLTTTWWELVLRASVVYLVLFVMFRFSGKRQLAQITPFDLLLLLIVSNAVQNAMVGSETSVTGGLVVALVLITWNHLLDWIARRNRKLETLLEGRAEVLVHNGRIDQGVLQRNHLSEDDLRTALRREGCFELDDVAFAVLETSGNISVKRRDTR